jgi:hypothetical protein
MEMNDDLKKEFDSVLEGFIPTAGCVLVLAQDNNYQSTNGVISTLKKGGSVLQGTVIRIGDCVDQDMLYAEVMFLKYKAEEVLENVFLLDDLVERQIKLYKKNG